VLHELAPRVDLRLSVAHLDHGSRGEASRFDAEFVAELAAALGLPFDLGRWRPTRAKHFETEARRARYDWLVQVARARGAAAVAVGHTRDDQAETILHRIVRGTGLRGLSGIPWRRRLATDPDVALVRPLLAASRDEIRHDLAERGQSFREDETNADLTRTRARIRHDLLPKLAAEYNPRIAEALVRLGGHAAGCRRAIEADARRIERAAVVSFQDGLFVLKQDFLVSLPDFLRVEVLRRLWRRAGWPEGGMSARRWRRLAALVRSREIPRTEIGAGVTIVTEKFFLILWRSRPVTVVAPGAVPVEPVHLEAPGVASVPWAGGRVVATYDDGEPAGEWIDADRVHSPLTIRPPVPGDRFEPLGMDGRSMPLADFFRGRGVPQDRRVRIPLVCDRQGIVWVVGHRIADRVKLTGATWRRMGLRWEAGL
jgi:tRNA(Ile)-lysidine synthase